MPSPADVNRAQPGAVWRDWIPGIPEDALPEMVTLPAGKFLMGAAPGEESAKDYNFPQHSVSISYTFALGKVPLTFRQWDDAIDAGAGLRRADDQGWGRQTRPLICVNWEDAQAYLAWVNQKTGYTGRPDAYRLPSEAEWEYAARAGTTTTYSTGATITSTQAWFDANSTCAVGSFAPNDFGLHDMHGNIWEWCEDSFSGDYQGAPDDGSALINEKFPNRICRGGSWYNSTEQLRSAARNWSSPDIASFFTGFRVARTLCNSEV